MSRKYSAIIVVVILLQVVNLFFYIQLRNFGDFEEAAYSERLIEPVGKNEPYHWTAKVYLPFAIINISEWMAPFHHVGDVMPSGMVLYSIPLNINLGTVESGSEGYKVPLEFLDGNFIDRLIFRKYTKNIQNLSDEERKLREASVLPSNFLNLRKFTHDLVFWGRVALITIIECLLILIFATILIGNTYWQKRRNERLKKIKEAYKLKDDLKALLSRLQPEFGRAWIIAQNTGNKNLPISKSEIELRAKFHETIQLVLQDYNYANILDFYSKAKNISITEFESNVNEFSKRIDEWVSNNNFQAHREKARMARLETAKVEYRVLTEKFRKYPELRDSKKYGKMYMEVMRTLNAIQSELKCGRVREKRFTYVHNSLTELDEGLKELKKGELNLEKTGTPV